jgi:hypothetical protein
VRAYSGHIHRKFVAILARPDLGLALVSKKGVCWTVAFDDHGKLRLRASTVHVWDYRASRRPFLDKIPLGDVGYKLAPARWDDGSEAFLDSRGLLHLRSSDSSVPELTIILADGELSGWCADGRVWGNDYFVGGQANADAREIHEDVIKRFLDRLL